MFYSDGSRSELEISLEKGGIEVDEWECIDPNDSKGHYILQQRIKNSDFYLSNMKKPDFEFEKDKRYLITGIGSSEAHAKYLEHVGNINKFNMKYIPIKGVTSESKNIYDKIVLFSQGLSPHGLKPINYFDKNDIILFTAVTKNNKNKDKLDVINKVSNVINYPIENEYDILIRTIGPICGFNLIDKMFNILNGHLKSYYIVPNDFISKIYSQQSVTLVINYPLTEYYQNLEYKFIEGAFIKTVNVVDELSFAHGYYQNVTHWGSNFILINSENTNVKTLLSNKNTFEIESKSLIEIEHIINIMILKLVRLGNINQKEWSGKDTQKFIYDN